MKPYYEHAGITIFHGDCREILPHVKADCVVTDGPYSISLAGVTHVGQPGNGSRRFDFFTGDADWPTMTALVVEAIAQAHACLPPTGSLYAWCGHRQFGPIVDRLESLGLSTRMVAWAKQCPAPAPPGSGWSSAFELCVYAYPAGRTWNGPAYCPNVLHSDSYRHGRPGKVDHPTQKPLAVISPLILHSSNVGDIILDPFMGSGTTLVAAKLEGRKAIGIEIEERYCEIAAKRLAQGVLDFGQPTT